MIGVLESDVGIAYVGDFMEQAFCPPLGGWIDGWCMLFKTEVIPKIGLFDEQYIWWYGPADYAIRTLRMGYSIKDLKKPHDHHNQIGGIVTHLGGRTFRMIEDDPLLPLHSMFRPDFRYENLLLRHHLYRYYLTARGQRWIHGLHTLVAGIVHSPVTRRIVPKPMHHFLKLMYAKVRRGAKTGCL
jgi:GT2 family glycosyltransferase